MNERKLRDAIDRMVEQSIRKILPQVMNEVLLATLANSMLRENQQIVQAPRKAPPVAKAMRAKPPRPAPSLKERLSEFVDDSAGRDFYDHLESNDEGLDGYNEIDSHRDLADEAFDEPVQEKVEMRKLSPALQLLAEDVQIPDDSSTSESIDHITAAKRLGIDFQKLNRTINKIENKSISNDLRAKHEFEDRRLKNMREQLAAQKVS